jgi:hypothetical protein
MARRWYNEDYRKLYTRQDGPWLSMPACARALAADLIRWADDKGVVAVVGSGETEAEAIAGVIRAKANEAEWVERAVTALMDPECRYLVKKGRAVCIRNFVDAQERLSQDAARKRRQRDREDQARDAGQHPDESVTEGVTSAGTDAGQESGQATANVTPNVTPLSAVSRRVETVREKPLARDARDAGERVSSLWTAASLEQLWADTYRLPSSPGDLPDLSRMLATTGRARGEEPAAFTAAFLAAFRDMLADWKRKGVHHGAPTTEGAISHFAATVAWLDEHSGSPEPDDDLPDAADMIRERDERRRGSK